MNKGEQTEPRAFFQIDPDGITVTVTARLREGSRNWTRDEAARWVEEVWRQAEQTLLAATLGRAMTEQSPTSLMREGDGSWRIERVTAPISKAKPDVPPSGINGDLLQDDCEQTQEVAVVSANDYDPKPYPSQVVSKPKGKLGRRSSLGDNLKRILQTIANAKDPIGIPDIKRITGLNDYRVRTVLSQLKEEGLVDETMIRTGGRWGELPFYSTRR